MNLKNQKRDPQSKSASKELISIKLIVRMGNLTSEIMILTDQLLSWLNESKEPEERSTKGMFEKRHN